MRIPVTLALAFLAFPLHAQQSAAPSSIRVTGVATVTAKPDRAHVDVGVVTQAPQSQTAASQNAQRLDAVLAALHKALGPGVDVRTISYSLNPDYQYHPNGGQPSISGYTATNVVRITLDDLGKIGNVIDTATQAGANRVPSIEFALRDEQATRVQALKEAAGKARAEADALAGALGLKVIRILTVEEGGPVAVPLRTLSMAEARAGPMAVTTPVQPGTIDVTANVTLTVEVAAR
jgi:uncharacterized protein YggE